MALTGNLQVFPLEEVLRLLARARKSGCLRVENPAGHGRVYLHQGALTFATTTDDEDFRHQLLAAGLVTDDGVRRIGDQPGATLVEALAVGVEASQLTDLVREQVVESLYRIRRPAEGAFDFHVDMAPRYPTGQSFDVEVCIAEADRRANEWADIETVVPSMTVPVRMAPSLPEEGEVTVSASTWRLLAALSGVASVEELSQRLGTTRFRVARELAALVRAGLVQLEQQPTAEPMPEPAVEPERVDQGGWYVHQPDPAPQPEPEAVTDPGYSEQPAYPPAWYETPQEPSGQFAAEPAEAETDSPPEFVPPVPDGGDATDSFLESVFSQMTEEDIPTDDDTDEGGFNMGLLRRRRMGAASRDITEGEH